jgi:hypothetical protein
MVMCVPPAHDGLKRRMQRDWGFGVVPAMSPQVFHNVERAARKKLAGRRSFAELASQRR